METDNNADGATATSVDPDLVDLPKPKTVDAPVLVQAKPESGVPDDSGARGWVPLYRSFQSQWWWERQPWSYAHIMMDLLARANVRARNAEYGGHVISIGRGQVATSMTAMANRAGLDRKTIARFLAKMEEEGELQVAKKGQDGIVVTICRYDDYALTKSTAAQ